MSRDISHLSRELPDPTPPGDLEEAVRGMLASLPSTPSRPARRLRAPLLAIPAAAALILVVMTVSPVPEGRSPRSPDSPVLAQSSLPGKAGEDREGSKSTVRTTPLSAYSRQASLISF